MFVRGLITAFALALAGCITVSGEDGEPGKPGLRADHQAFLDTCEDWDEWNKPAPPFKVHGDTYYVGTCGIAAILITDEDGHVLIDTGTRAGADVVLTNIVALGFAVEDINFMLHSHEHFDHVGGFAFMAYTTGAEVVASVGAMGPLNSGLSSPDDPQHDMHSPMEPVRPSTMVRNGQKLDLGGLALTAIETPGHTPGALTWQWESCERDECKTIVYADSLSPVSSEEYRFSDHPEYLAEYYAGLERLGQLDCDILLTPHPSHSRMLKRMRDSEMIDPAACGNYAIGKANDLKARLNREAGGDQ
ncbi:Beta-lactamase [Altererythrobacter insulae]|nr:Beta-lactamase [Altererythrobacter insulae]